MSVFDRIEPLTKAIDETIRLGDVADNDATILDSFRIDLESGDLVVLTNAEYQTLLGRPNIFPED